MILFLCCVSTFWTLVRCCLAPFIVGFCLRFTYYTLFWRFSRETRKNFVVPFPSPDSSSRFILLRLSTLCNGVQRRRLWMEERSLLRRLNASLVWNSWQSTQHTHSTVSSYKHFFSLFGQPISSRLFSRLLRFKALTLLTIKRFC